MIKTRRYDLDWLRLIAFGILIYFHAAIIFVPGGLPLVQNDVSSPLMDAFVAFSSQFRLGLLFLISGVGVAFARRRRTTPEFIVERSKRLLIPFALGLVLIVPLCIYFERLHLGEIDGDFLAFYPTIFSGDVYPKGNLSWHHFWFIAYLYIFCLVGLKVFSFLEGNRGTLFLNKVESFFQGYNIYLFVLVLFAVELPLRFLFPGFRDLIHDWASFSHWLLLFLVGYILANREQLLEEITRMRFVSLLLATISTGLFFTFFYNYNAPVLTIDDPDLVFKYPAYCFVTMLLAWSCLLSCLGFAGKHLRFNNSALVYLNEAVYPLFVLHLTVIALFGYLIVPFELSISLKYLSITSLTVFTCLSIYHIGIRPFNSMRFLFGVKAKPAGNTGLEARALL